MKTRLVLGVMLVLLVGAAWFLRTLITDGEDTGLGKKVPVESGEAEAIRRRAHGNAAPIAADSAPASAPAESMPSSAPAGDAVLHAFVENFGSLVLHVVWAEDKSPAASVRVEGYAFGAPDPYAEVRWYQTDDLGDVRIEKIHAGKVSFSTVFGGDLRTEVKAGETAAATLEIPKGEAVAGTVVDPHGAPVGGAEIVMTPEHSMIDGVVVAMSAPDGTFRLRSVAMQGFHYIGAKKQGYGPSLCVGLLGIATEAKAALRLVLAGAGGTVEGRILDADGAPVADARVTVGDNDTRQLTLPDGMQGCEPVRLTTRTDPAGRFRFDGLAVGVRHIAVRARRWAPWRGEVNIEKDQATKLEVRLEPGATLFGIVRNAAGEPVAKVDVETKATAWDDRGFARTAEDGRYRIESIAGGKVTVAADARNGMRARAETTLSAGAETRLDLVVREGPAIRGIVLDENGAPIVDVAVEISTMNIGDEFDSRFIRTDDQGRFRAASCHDMDYEVAVRHPTASSSTLLRREKIRPGGDEIVLRLSRDLLGEATILGSVVGPDGQALGGVEVLCSRDGDRGTIIRTADPVTGTFQAKSVAPGTYVVSIHAGDLPVHRSESRILKGGDVWDLGVIRLAKGATAMFRLARPEGAHGPITVSAEGSAGGADRTTTTTTDTAVLSGLAAGRWTYAIDADGLSAAPGEFTVAEGESVTIDVGFIAATTIVLTIPLSESGPWTSKVDVTMNEAAGGTPVTATLWHQRGRPIEWRRAVQPGKYTIDILSDRGQKGRISLNVRENAGVLPVQVEIE